MTFGALNLAGGSTIVTGTLPPANGGTNSSNGAVTTLCAGIPNATITSTEYVGFGSLATSLNESQAYMPVPVSGTVASFYAQMSGSPAGTTTFKVRYNGGYLSFSSGTCQITTSTTSCAATSGTTPITEATGNWDIEVDGVSGTVSRNYSMCIKVIDAN